MGIWNPPCYSNVILPRVFRGTTFDTEAKSSCHLFNLCLLRRSEAKTRRWQLFVASLLRLVPSKIRGKIYLDSEQFHLKVPPDSPLNFHGKFPLVFTENSFEFRRKLRMSTIGFPRKILIPFVYEKTRCNTPPPRYYNLLTIFETLLHCWKPQYFYTHFYTRDSLVGISIFRFSIFQIKVHAPWKARLTFKSGAGQHRWPRN